MTENSRAEQVEVPELEKVLRTIPEQIPGIELAYLFGSQASGTTRDDSDIDPARRCRQPLPVENRAHLIGSAAEATGRAVDIIDLSGEPEPVTGKVLNGRCRIGDDAAEVSRLIADREPD